MQKNELDHIDKKILNILMHEAKKSLKEIAETVYLSIPAVSARIEKLEKEGYILGYYARINTSLTGFPVHAFIQIEVSHNCKEDFCSMARKRSEIIECNSVTGEYTMIMEVCFASMAELEKFIGELQEYGKTKTHVVYSTPVEHRGIPVA